MYKPQTFWLGYRSYNKHSFFIGQKSGILVRLQSDALRNISKIILGSELLVIGSSLVLQLVRIRPTLARNGLSC